MRLALQLRFMFEPRDMKNSTHSSRGKLKKMAPAEKREGKNKSGTSEIATVVLGSKPNQAPRNRSFFLIQVGPKSLRERPNHGRRVLAERRSLGDD